MKKLFLLIIFTFAVACFTFTNVSAQCSICAKTTQQMGEKPAKAFNNGIIYLMLAPFGIVGFVGYRWWKNGKHES